MHSVLLAEKILDALGIEYKDKHIARIELYCSASGTPELHVVHHVYDEEASALATVMREFSIYPKEATDAAETSAVDT